MDERCQRTGAVDARGLVERRVDVLQAGEQQQRDERRRLPDVGEDDRHPGEMRVVEPQAAALARPRREQQRVGRAACSNRKRHSSATTTVGIAHGKSASVRASAAAAKRRCRQQREHEAEHELERHADRGERRVWPSAPRSARSPSASRVVGEPDERPAAPRHAQVVQVQRLPDRVGQREERDRSDREQRRRAQRERQPASLRSRAGAARGFAQPSRSRSCAGAARGVEARAREQRRDLARRGRCSAAPGSPARSGSGARAICRMSDSSAYTGVDGPRDGAVDDARARRPAGSAARARARGPRRATRRGGNCPATRARSSICAGCVRNSITAYAASGWSLRALIASCEPPSAAAGRPPGRRPASARRAKRPATARVVRLQQRDRRRASCA